MKPDVFFGTKFDTHTLAVNYRSPANIVTHSQLLIAHNTRRVPKETNANRGDKAQIVIQKTSSLSETLDYVYNFVQEHIGSGKSPSRIAIIGRKRSQIIPSPSRR